jgi:hypothetical protein
VLEFCIDLGPLHVRFTLGDTPAHDADLASLVERAPDDEALDDGETRIGFRA